jgi:NADPH2:quinone reductase
VQLARAAGARVFGTSRTGDKLLRATEYGLSASVAVGNDPARLIDPVREWTGGKGVDVVLDLVGASYLEANLAALANQGRLMFVGTTSGAEARLNIGMVMSKRLKLRGTVLRARSAEEKARATSLFARHVVPLLAEGSVRAVVDSVYKMEEVRDAHLRLESNQSFGKIVLEIG